MACSLFGVLVQVLMTIASRGRAVWGSSRAHVVEIVGRLLGGGGGDSWLRSS